MTTSLNLKPIHAHWAAFFLISFFFLLQAASTAKFSETLDEGRHWSYGQMTLGSPSNRIFDSMMPVTALNALPKRAARVLPAGGELRNTIENLNTARLVTLAAWAVLAWLVYRWALALFGPAGGLLSLTLFVVDPNVRGHSIWVTTDLYCALGVTGLLFALWRWIKKPSFKTAVVWGLWMGFAQATKYSAVLLFIVLPVIAFLPMPQALSAPASDGPAQPPPSTRRPAAGIFLHFLAACLIALFVMNAVYLFKGTGQPLAKYEFTSQAMQSIQIKLKSASWLPVPLPKPYVEGLDLTIYHENKQIARGSSYLLGKSSTLAIGEKGYFANYFAIVWLLKTPIALQILLLWALGGLWALPDRRTRFTTIVFFILPAAVFFIYFNFFCRAQLGIRHILMIYPLTHLLCGSLLAGKMRDIKVAALGLLLTYLTVSSLSYYPHSLSYMNEVIGDRKNAYRYLADSNLDWAQGQFYMRDYSNRFKPIFVNPPQPYVGRNAIAVNLVTGVMQDERSWYGWLLENKEPVEHVAHAYLIYELNQDDVVKILKYQSARAAAYKGRRAEPVP